MATQDDDFTPVTARRTPALRYPTSSASSVPKSTLNDQKMPAKSVLISSSHTPPITTHIKQPEDPTRNIADWKNLPRRISITTTNSTTGTQRTFDLATAFYGLVQKLLDDEDKELIRIHHLQDDSEYLTRVSMLPTGKKLNEYAQAHQGPHDNNQAQIFMLLQIGIPSTFSFVANKAGILDNLQAMNIWFVEHIFESLAIKSIGYLLLKCVKEVNNTTFKETIHTSLQYILRSISLEGLSPSQIAIVKTGQAQTQVNIPFNLQTQKVLAYPPKDAPSPDLTQSKKKAIFADVFLLRSTTNHDLLLRTLLADITKMNLWHIGHFVPRGIQSAPGNISIPSS